MTSKTILSPGSGWKYLGVQVWEHVTGVRIHVTARLVMFKNRDVRNLHQIPGAYDIWFFLYRCGRNPKRAMMAIAQNVAICKEHK